MEINILKEEKIKEYKLDKDYEFMEKLRNNITDTLKMQEETIKTMIEKISQPFYYS